MVHRGSRKRKKKKGRETIADLSQMITQLITISEMLTALSAHLLLKQGRQNVTVLLASFVNVMGLPTQQYNTICGQK